MSRRTLILLMVAVTLWGFVIYFLFFSGFGPFKKVSSPPPRKTEQSVKNVRSRLTPKIVDEYEAIVREGIKVVDLFSPKELGLSTSALNELIMLGENEIPDMEFVGYIMDDRNERIFIRYGGKEYVFHKDDLIFKRFLVIHVSSLGMVVLDLEKGGMGIIR